MPGQLATISPMLGWSLSLLTKTSRLTLCYFLVNRWVVLLCFHEHLLHIWSLCIYWFSMKQRGLQITSHLHHLLDRSEVGIRSADWWQWPAWPPQALRFSNCDESAGTKGVSDRDPTHQRRWICFVIAPLHSNCWNGYRSWIHCWHLTHVICLPNTLEHGGLIKV